MIEEQREEEHLFNKGKKILDIIDTSHPLVKLANSISWDALQVEFNSVYPSSTGLPIKPVRLMIGLHYLRYMFNLSEESIVYHYIENPYYQYFCGETIFQHDFPIDRSSMSKFRGKLKKRKLYKLLQETIHTGFKNKIIKKTSVKKVVIDSTVSESNIAYPTDAKLYYKGIKLLVKEAYKYNITLRQKYTFKAKRALIMVGRYNHAKQFRRRNKAIKELKVYLGRVYRDFIRKSAIVKLQDNTNTLLNSCNKLLSSTKYSKDKLYSFHKPNTLCISKGKVHKRYEFGFKASFITTTKECFIVNANAIKSNIYDGHTLKDELIQAKNNIKDTKTTINYLYADKGYRGHKNNTNTQVVLETTANKKRYKDLKRRSSIEAVISHLKRYHRLGTNYLKEENNDINTILSACGYNLKKIYKNIKKCLFLSTQNLKLLQVNVKNVCIPLKNNCYTNLYDNIYEN